MLSQFIFSYFLFLDTDDVMNFFFIIIYLSDVAFSPIIHVNEKL